MSKDSGPPESESLMIAYKELGTISIDELVHAIIEDIHVLQDIYNIQYLRGASLRFYPTDEYGSPVRVKRPAGGTLRYMTTQHFRPACKDYDL